MVVLFYLLLALSFLFIIYLRRIKKVVIKKMYDWALQNFGSFDNFILFLLAVGLFIVISLMFAALRLIFHDDINNGG